MQYYLVQVGTTSSETARPQLQFNLIWSELLQN